MNTDQNSLENSGNDFMLLFRGGQWYDGLSPEEIQQVMARTIRWFENLQAEGVVKRGHPLGETGKTVFGSKRGGVVDGPYAESKEAIGGYLLISAKDFDAAVEIARSFPKLDYGVAIEVRPILDECPDLKNAKLRSSLAAA